MNNIVLFFESIDKIISNKNQANAVKSLFNICFESAYVDSDGSFVDPNEGWQSYDLKQMVDPASTNNKHVKNLLAMAKDKRENTGISDKTERELRNASSDVVSGSFDRMAKESDTRRKIERIQEMLNAKYGLNLAVDGKWGKQTDAAWKRHKNQLAVNKEVARRNKIRNEEIAKDKEKGLANANKKIYPTDELGNVLPWGTEAPRKPMSDEELQERIKPGMAVEDEHCLAKPTSDNKPKDDFSYKIDPSNYGAGLRFN